MHTYGLYYDPAFEIRSASYLHIGYTPTEEIEGLMRDIPLNGLRNPLFVFAQEGNLVIHPGKCRAQALLALGIERAKAVIYAPDAWRPDGFEPITPEAAAALFTKDMRAFFTAQDFHVARIRPDTAVMPSESPLKRFPPVYRLAYDAHFDIGTADATLVGPKRDEIEQLRLSIADEGLRNPLFVTCSGNRRVIHPGKHRVAALRALGISDAPAVLYSPDGSPLGQGHRIAPAEAANLFRFDLVCEWDSRFFAVKRINRPNRPRLAG